MSNQMLQANDSPARYNPSYALDRYAPRPMAPPEEESLKSVWLTLRKWKYWIATVTLVTFGLAVLVCIFLPPQYTGTATIHVGKDDSANFNPTREPTGATPQDELKTEMATPLGILQDDSIALAVVNDLHLQNYKPFAYQHPLVSLHPGTNKQIESERGLPLDQAPATRERILKLFAKKLKVQNIPDTRLITVSFTSSDPKLATEISNDVVRQYTRYVAQSKSTGEASKWLSDQLDELKNKVESSQKNLAEYEKETGLNTLLLGSLGQGGSAGGVTHIPALDKLDVLNQELTGAETTRLAKESIYHLTQTQNPEVVGSLASSGLQGTANSAVFAQGNGLQTLQQLRQQQATLKLTYADYETKYGAKNPRRLEIGNQLTELDKQLSDELVRINTRARNDYLLARQDENALRAAYSGQQQKAGKLNESAVQLQVLAQEATSSRQLYDSLYARLQEANVQAGLRATDVGLADPARVPATPTRPNPPLYLAVGLAAGLLFGIVSAFVREHMDETVKTPLQVNSSIQAPVLGSIPLSAEVPRLSSSHSSFNRQNALETSPLITHPRSSVAEAYRSLRTSLMFSAGARPMHTLLVTSPLVGDGKTTIAYNLGVAFARAGQHVCLVDADIRNPRLHEAFGVEKTPGLSDVLSNGHAYEKLVREHSSLPSLSLLPAGTPSSMSAELLGSRQFDELLQTLKQKYSLIILDSPPTLLVTDASVMSEKVDTTIAVLRAGKTTGTVLGRISEMLERSGSAVGFVLNAVDTKSLEYFQAYGHNGSGKYYEEINA